MLTKDHFDARFFVNLGDFIAMHSARRSLVRILGCDASLPLVAHAKWPVSLLLDTHLDLSRLSSSPDVELASPFHLPRSIKRLNVSLTPDYFVNGGPSFGIRKFVNHHFVRLQFHSPHVTCSHCSFHEPLPLATLAPPSISLEAVDGSTAVIYVPSFEDDLAEWRLATARYKSFVASILAAPPGTPPELESYVDVHLPPDLVDAALADDPEGLEEDPMGPGGRNGAPSTSDFAYTRHAVAPLVPHDALAKEQSLCDDLVRVGVVDVVDAWRHYNEAVDEHRRGLLDESGVAARMVAFRARAIEKAGGVGAVGAAISAHRRSTSVQEADVDENSLRGASDESVDGDGEEAANVAHDAVLSDLAALYAGSAMTDGGGQADGAEDTTPSAVLARAPAPPTRADLHAVVADCVLGAVLTAAARLDADVGHVPDTPPPIGDVAGTWVNWECDALHVGEATLRRRMTLSERARRRFGALVDADHHPTVSRAVRGWVSVRAQRVCACAVFVCCAVRVANAACLLWFV